MLLLQHSICRTKMICVSQKLSWQRWNMLLTSCGHFNSYIPWKCQGKIMFVNLKWYHVPSHCNYWQCILMFLHLPWSEFDNWNGSQVSKHWSKPPIGFSMPVWSLVQESCSAALDACTRCLVEEMKAVASVGNANCCVIEDSTSSTANGNDHNNGSNTAQPENILWKRFD